VVIFVIFTTFVLFVSYIIMENKSSARSTVLDNMREFVQDFDSLLDGVVEFDYNSDLNAALRFLKGKYWTVFGNKPYLSGAVFEDMRTLRNRSSSYLQSLERKTKISRDLWNCRRCHIMLTTPGNCHICGNTPDHWDVELVMQQFPRASHEQALRALFECDGDAVGAMTALRSTT